MITSIEFAQLLQKQQKRALGKNAGFDSALLNLGVAFSGKKTEKRKK